MFLTTVETIKMIGPLFIVGFIILLFGFSRALLTEMKLGFNLRGREEAKKRFTKDVKGFSVLLICGYLIFLATIIIILAIGREYVKYIVGLMILGALSYVALKVKQVRQQALQ